jgi:hypothetical protein
MGEKPAATRYNRDGRMPITSVRLDEDDFDALIQLADRRRTSVAELVRRAVSAWLREANDPNESTPAD